MKTIISTLLLLSLTVFGYSQGVKDEVEKRIKMEEMPKTALKSLKEMPIDLEKTKFYFEKDTTAPGFEAKVKLKKKKFSIEFDYDGNLSDIEIKIDADELPKTIKETIITYLENTFERHKIEKVQQHFFAHNIENAFGAADKPDQYELIVATKNQDNDLEKKEIVFDASGKHLKTLKIVRRSYDFLLF